MFNMSALFLLLCLTLVVSMVYGEPFGCQNKYTPSKFIGSLRVPTNCAVSTPSYCPRSWKSGIPEGRSTSTPLIYSEFITCHEGFALCGYVPINPRTGKVLGTSGVTIGAGVDLGSKSKTSPAFSSLSIFLVGKLEPYFGLRQNLAACAAIERRLNLFSSEATTLTNAVKENVAEEVEKRYNKDKASKALAFASIPRGIRTAIASVWFHFGYPEAYRKFWNHVIKNAWEEAVHELRNFYTNPGEQQQGDLRRRNNEADIIEATFVKCNRSLDAVILLDESGSVSSQSFNESLSFVKNLITAFPDEKLRGNKSTRFGLSTFSNNYHPRFYLASYTSRSEYQSAIDAIIQARGGTLLGAALGRILVDQFTEQRGLRSEEHGFPRVLIVLTDGQSYDVVSFAAQHVRDQNIVIYAIGIGNYDSSQLVEVASSPSHVYTLSTFVELETFIATLTAATCNEPQPISLNKEVKITTKKNQYQYFLYSVDKDSNLEMTVNDVSGETSVYASRSNPHPYKYDNDVSFDSSYRKDKVLVISPNEPQNTITKGAADDEKQSIYISVTANTENALFTIEGTTCHPLNCTEGTNAISAAAPSYKKGSSSFASLAVSFIVFYFCY